MGARIIVYGNPSGGLTSDVHKRLSYLNSRFKGSFFYSPNYTEHLAHKFLAGSDIFLAPSLFEPCGLAQIYAMAFGAVPIVRPVGGLKDTVKCHNEFPFASTGFHIKQFSSDSLAQTINEAIQIFKHEKYTWKHIQRRAMLEDFSWDKMKEQYFDFFDQVEESTVL